MNDLRIPNIPFHVSREAAMVAAFRAALMIVVALVVLLVIRRALRRMTQKERIDATSASFIGAVLRYLVWIVVVIALLSEFGLDTSSLMGSLGIVGLTLGFAARDALSNVISGLFILWDRPFTIGDLIEIDGRYGRVSTITMRSTRVVTPDGRMLAIPNAVVLNSTVASYTNFPHLRIDIPLTIGVEEDIEGARKVLLGAIADEEGLLADREHRVIVSALNDYNIAIELQVWIEKEGQHIPMRQRLKQVAFEALRDAGVHMPYETLELVRPAAAAGA